MRDLRVKLVRRLSLEEVQDRIRRMEKHFKMSFDEFEENFLEGKLDRGLWGFYVEWAELQYALEAYEESGELEYVEEERVNIDLNDLCSIFTPEKLKILVELGRGVDSISELSRRVGRSLRNVHRDLKYLEEKGLVRLMKGIEADRRIVKPKILVNEISVEFP